MSAPSGGITQPSMLVCSFALGLRADAEPQVGGFNSPASQPLAPDVMGSLHTMVVCTRPHFWHSKVRQSQPDGPDSSFDSSIRFWLQLGQRGRSIAATCAEDTGWYSGMIHSCMNLGALPSRHFPKTAHGRRRA
jgi:hypothetical protein